MTKEWALIQLKREIEMAPRLVEGEYIGLRDAEEGEPKCFCAVGHIFKLGGAEDSQIEALETEVQSHGANGIQDVIDDTQVAQWVRSAGLDPDEDYPFLRDLQHANDNANDNTNPHYRKFKVIEVIDSYLSYLQSDEN